MISSQSKWHSQALSLAMKCCLGHAFYLDYSIEEIIPLYYREKDIFLVLDSVNFNKISRGEMAEMINLQVCQVPKLRP